MQSFLKLILIILCIAFVSCGSPYKSLFSTEEKVIFTNNDISKEEINFTYIPFAIYSPHGGSNSKRGADSYRENRKRYIDSLISLRHTLLGVTDKINLSEKLNMQDSLQEKLIQLIDEVDHKNSIRSIKLPLFLEDILQKAPTNFSLSSFTNLNLITFADKHSKENMMPQNNILLTRDLTTYIFIFDNSEKKLIHFYKSKKIKDDISDLEQYTLIENQVLKFIGTYNK